MLFFTQEDFDNRDKVSTPRSESSTSGSNTPEPRHDGRGSSPLLGQDAGASNENVLKNIFTSLSCRGETSMSGRTEQQLTVKHVRLMNMVEPVQRDDDDYS